MSSEMSDGPGYTLAQFISWIEADADGGAALAKIKSIVLDTDQSAIRHAALNSDKPVDIIRMQPNLLSDDAFLTKNEDGEYSIDTNKIVDRYKNFYVTLCCPLVEEEDADEAMALQELAAVTGNSEEYIKEIAKLATQCDIIISDKKPKPEFVKSAPAVYVPRFKSTINCWMMFDFRYLDEDALMEDDDSQYVDSHIFPIGCVETIQAAQDVIKKRKSQYTAVCQVVNGRVKTKSYSVYFTDYDGTIQLISTE